MEKACKNCKWYMYTTQQCRYWSSFDDGLPFHLKSGVGGTKITIKKPDSIPDFCAVWESVGKWQCFASGFWSTCPVNIADGVAMFMIHAEPGEEVFRLVDYLNSQYEEKEA